LSQNMRITVLVSSHILSEVQQLATRIGIIHKGKMLEEIESDSLQKKNRQYVEIKTSDDKNSAVILEQIFHIFDYKIMEPGIIRIYERLNDQAAINRVLIENGIEIKNSMLMNNTLEDYFIELTGGVHNV